MAYKKIIGCNNVNKLRALEKYLYKVRCRCKRRFVCIQGERIDWGGGGGVIFIKFFKYLKIFF
jgi:hypothetical protein